MGGPGGVAAFAKAGRAADSRAPEARPDPISPEVTARLLVRLQAAWLFAVCREAPRGCAYHHAQARRVAGEALTLALACPNPVATATKLVERYEAAARMDRDGRRRATHASMN